MAILVSISEHHSATVSFKCFSSDTMLLRMMGSLLRSVAFRCMKQLSLAKDQELLTTNWIEATPLSELKASASPYASASPESS